MPDSRATIKFPPRIARHPVSALHAAASQEEVLELMIKLALAVYSRADEARAAGHDQAVPAHFLRLFVDLIDILEENGADDASFCMRDLSTVITAIYP